MFGWSNADRRIRVQRGVPSAASQAMSSWYAALVVLVGLKMASQAQPSVGSAIVRGVIQWMGCTSLPSSKMNSMRWRCRPWNACPLRLTYPLQ
jgi:hypothetical protein